MNDYTAYMLRIWQEDNQPAKRFSLESPQTGRRIGFANLAALVAFLNSDQNDSSQDNERGNDE